MMDFQLFYKTASKGTFISMHKQTLKGRAISESARRSSLELGSTAN
jgi:hypothetical protein